LSQENCKQKRRWLKRILGARSTTALWLAPALLSPALSMTVLPSASGYAQAPNVVQATSVATPTVNVEFVTGWLEYAAKQAEAGDLSGSAKSFAEALRGRQLLKVKDEKLEARVKEVEALVVSKGMTRSKIVDAIGSLGALAAAPKSPLAKSSMGQPSQLPALPGLPPVVAAGSQPPLPAGTPAVHTASNASMQPNAVTPGVYNPSQDSSSLRPASTQIDLAVPAPLSGNASGDELYRRGVELLGQGQREQALEHFRRAWQFEREMDPALRNQLKDKLSLLSNASSSVPNSPSASPLRQATEEELAVRQKMMSEVTGEIAAAEANREAEPQVVAERLQTLRTRVSQANMDGNARKQMLTIVDRAIASHQIYMTQNRAMIDQNMHNRQVTEQMALDQEERFKIDQQIASLVETYNDLMDKKSFYEAEVVAKQVGVLDPDSTIASLLISNSRNARRIGEYEQIKSIKEDKFIDNMLTVDEAAIPFDDREPLLFPNAKEWSDLTKRRANQLSEAQQGMSPATQKIWGQLKQPVLVDFKDRPLGEVLRTLSDMSGVPIHMDLNGLAAEGVTTDSPVTLSLSSQISLRSALNLIVHPLNLDFQPQNDVLTVTSMRNGSKANVTRTYNVRDFVIPIPNFVTDYNSGMAGAIRQAYETMGRGLVARNSGGLAGLNNDIQLASATSSLDPNAPVLGQLANPSMMGFGGNLPAAGGFGMNNGGFGLNTPGGSFGGGPMNMGGGAQGGGSQANFSQLMMLIMQTIDPLDFQSGDSTMSPFQQTLSLVVSAPQTTHEKIEELLETLRRQQLVQVTIEVKFITLNDNFFERIGVDFDLRIDDNVGRLPQDDQGNSAVVGLSGGVSATNAFPVTADFDVAFTQDSFANAIPPFGGVFNSDAGGSIGFAILSDLEMFFFMNAAQGDQRSNILQAPRVTMFDGQQASITDNVSRPFVTSLIPVVADFAVAQQPVIVVLNEGTTLNVQATCSPDKRFVRLTLNPSFTQIDRVDTFTFEGTRTTRSNSRRTGTNILNPQGTVNDSNDEDEVVVTGTTVQQPSLASTNISTTVNVPDGGTILLGGIKRMREGRVERGVPILSKIPYVNRLFKNTAIGRETSTLMMTVTPRIIIQEEEEIKYGVNP
jgi:general secretion pathway protein D